MLHRIREPILQVPQTEQHRHECVAAYYSGASTPAVNPILYIKCVRAAFDAYLELIGQSGDKLPPPLIVNTHGWVTGMGIELVRTILAITRPQLVLRISNEAPQATTTAT